MTVRQSSIDVIEAHLRFSAFYRGYLANHLPMAVVSLDAMGASDERIAGYAAGYAEQLEPLGPARFEIVEGEEVSFLGRPEAFPAWVEYFAARIAAEGADAVLREWVDLLCTAVGSAAFHGAIRLAFAVEARSERELAHALAYWAAGFTPMRAAPVAGGHETAEAVLLSIAHDARHAGRTVPGKNIAERTRAAASAAGFAELAARAGQPQLDAMAAALIRAYAASGNFTLLHGVTGCQAFRVLLPFVRDPEIALRHLWQAVLAAYIGSASPPVEGWKLEGDAALPWADVHRNAIECDDEHDIKLAYACWREWQRTNDDLYRRVASAVVSHAHREATA